MLKFRTLAVYCVVLFAGSAVQTSAQEKQALRLVRTIPLPEVTGRLDHMGMDLERKRLFVAAVTNNTLEVVVIVAHPVSSIFRRPPTSLLRRWRVAGLAASFMAGWAFAGTSDSVPPLSLRAVADIPYAALVRSPGGGRQR
jgi:hypothetical protein